MTTSTPAKLKSLSELVEEYDEKLAEIPERLDDLRAAEKAIEMGATIGGTFTHSIWGRSNGTSSVTQRDLEAALLRSAWRHVYDGLNIAKIAPASDRAKYERELESPPPFTIGNIRANFGTYLLSPREHILRGLAEVFSSLDPAFKSHSKVKIGVKALPKRVILSGFGEYSWGSYGQDKLRDILNAIASLDARPLVSNKDIDGLKRKARDTGEAEWWGGKLRVFRNGNAHLFFSPDALNLVNKGLAEYYGDVLPDTPDEDAKPKPGTEVAKDLQFYPTPDAIADKIVQKAFPRGGMRILEPSCGDGAILKAVQRFAKKERVQGLRVAGYEVDATRAACARQVGFSVTRANFLDVPPEPIFDMVLMNPPFYGKHYQKHVEHARRFLKPDGVLYAILPVTAATDHGFVDISRWGRDAWEDLPVGSFAASGTRINTGIARFFPRERG
jgi:SAM-dependent methyltransferase